MNSWKIVTPSLIFQIQSYFLWIQHLTCNHQLCYFCSVISVNLPRNLTQSIFAYFCWLIDFPKNLWNMLSDTLASIKIIHSNSFIKKKHPKYIIFSSHHHKEYKKEKDQWKGIITPLIPLRWIFLWKLPPTRELVQTIILLETLKKTTLKLQVI